MAINNDKPVIVYLHRYPPEIEKQQWPALQELVNIVTSSYTLLYISMRPPAKPSPNAIREQIMTWELPFSVNQASGRDKWFKTLIWYINIPLIIRKIKNLNPALIICKETLPFIPGWIARLGIPTIIETSDWWWSILLGQTGWGRTLANLMEAYEVHQWNRGNVKATVSTMAEAKLLAAKGMAHVNIEIINASQIPGVFHPLQPAPTRESLGLSDNLKYFAVFGIIRGGKGYDQLFDWWKTAAQKHNDWRLVIIGGAGGEHWCRRQLKQRELQSTTHMTGWLPTKEEVNRWLNVMDALIVHRRNSTDNQGIMPSALFNGLYTGRPVVATGLQGIAEIVKDGHDGFLFTPDDESSFISALERAVADPDAAARIGKAGLARAIECFNPQTAAKAHLLLIDKMTETSRHSTLNSAGRR